MSDPSLRNGDRVRLLSLPTGCSSQHLPLTVGNIYIFRFSDGSNVCTSTGRPGLDGQYNRDRVEKVESNPKP